MVHRAGHGLYGAEGAGPRAWARIPARTTANSNATAKLPPVHSAATACPHHQCPSGRHRRTRTSMVCAHAPWGVQAGPGSDRQGQFRWSRANEALCRSEGVQPLFDYSATPPHRSASGTLDVKVRAITHRSRECGAGHAVLRRGAAWMRLQAGHPHAPSASRTARHYTRHRGRCTSAAPASRVAVTGSRLACR